MAPTGVSARLLPYQSSRSHIDTSQDLLHLGRQNYRMRVQRELRSQPNMLAEVTIACRGNCPARGCSTLAARNDWEAGGITRTTEPDWADGSPAPSELKGKSGGVPPKWPIYYVNRIAGPLDSVRRVLPEARLVSRRV